MNIQNNRAFTQDVITLRGEEIIVRSGYVAQHDLRFYSENPRIYSQVWIDPEIEPTQEAIYQQLIRSEHVRDHLIPNIRHNGGLIEPVLVRQNVVLEGNSRLAAYRALYSENTDKWNFIRVRILPDEVTESQVFSLLGEFHIVGKKDWGPYEQAGYLWRRFRKHNVSEDELKSEVGLSKQKIRHLIHVYGFMLEHDEREPTRWSYYDELFTGKRFDDARELYPNFDDLITEKIKSEEIKRAVDLRDELPLILQAGNKVLRKFMEGRFDFEEAVIDARTRGAGNTSKKKLDDFRKWLGEDERDDDIGVTSGEERNAIRFALQKIHHRADSLIRKHFPEKSKP